MKPEREDLFPPLDPPPGGAALLRSRLEREDARRRRLPVVALGMASAAAVLLVALSVTLRIGASSPWSADDDPSLIRLGLAAAPSEPVEIPRSERGMMAATRVDVDDPKVVFYLVASAL